MAPNFLLIGGNRDSGQGPLMVFASMARNRGFDVSIISEPWHLALACQDGRSLQTHLDAENFDYHSFDELTLDRIIPLVDKDTICLLMNCMWIIKSEVIDALQPRILNYHAARLPEERGAAAYSWKILSSSKQGGLTFHHVTPEVDVGAIVAAEAFTLPQDVNTCEDYYAHLHDHEVRLFQRFLDAAVAGTLGESQVQDESAALYWPRLHTGTHGFLDWQWTASEVVAFCNAFDRPHPGAITFLDGVPVRLRDCRTEDGGYDFHPFQAGIVVRKTDDRVYIAARAGLISSGEVEDRDGGDISNSIRLGKRFHTPREHIERALTSHSRLSPQGLKF